MYVTDLVPRSWPGNEVSDTCTSKSFSVIKGGGSSITEALTVDGAVV